VVAASGRVLGTGFGSGGWRDANCACVYVPDWEKFNNPVERYYTFVFDCGDDDSYWSDNERRPLLEGKPPAPIRNWACSVRE
jgi:hypothetical protein